ncbi:MAG TPA: hypothetical protein VNR60_11070 [Croceibacterium sp.]|nr:hypothetical protein [Croceibacterium sp.]
MYSFIDVSPDRVAGGSRFLFWAMRGWSSALARDICPAASLAQAFVRKGMAPVLADFHKLMFVLNHREYRLIPFTERGIARVTEFEAIMLSLWSDIAEGEHGRARATLGAFLDENWIEDVVTGMSDVVGHMADIGLTPSRSLDLIS